MFCLPTLNNHIRGREKKREREREESEKEKGERESFHCDWDMWGRGGKREGKKKEGGEKERGRGKKKERGEEQKRASKGVNSRALFGPKKKKIMRLSHTKKKHAQKNTTLNFPIIFQRLGREQNERKRKRKCQGSPTLYSPNVH